MKSDSETAEESGTSTGVLGVDEDELELLDCGLLELLLDCGLLELLDCTEDDEELLSAVDELLSSAEVLLDCSAVDEVVVFVELLESSEAVPVELLFSVCEPLVCGLLSVFSPQPAKAKTIAADKIAPKIFCPFFILLPFLFVSIRNKLFLFYYIYIFLFLSRGFGEEYQKMKKEPRCFKRGFDSKS